MSKQALTNWLHLLRVPNLFTVPGDPLAGYLLATTTGFSASVLLPIGASLCFYSAGLLLNDLVDLDEDRRDRPLRPLPSGAVKPATVRKAAGALVIAGTILAIFGGAAAVFIGCGLFAAVLTYNFGAKRSALIGPLNMGLCRGLSLLLGAAFGMRWDATIFTAAFIIACYVAAVTILARYETGPSAPIAAKCLPVLVLVAAAAAFNFDARINNLTFSAFFLIAIVSATAATVASLKNQPLPPIIGSFIRTLIPIQAAFCAGSNTGWYGGAAALLLLALAPISRIVGRHFYAS